MWIPNSFKQFVSRNQHTICKAMETEPIDTMYGRHMMPPFLSPFIVLHTVRPRSSHMKHFSKRERPKKG
jgi:hypothetical protein